jgi:hypothetical protein
MRVPMRRAKVTLVFAIAILLCGYIVAAFLVPRMPGLGFERVLALGGAVGVVSFVVGAVLAARAGIIAAIALRYSRAERTIAGYVTLILSSLVSLAVATILIVAFIQP